MNISTPEPSVSGDSPVEPEKTTLSVCRELIAGGIIAVYERFHEQIVRLKSQGDIAAGELYNSIDQLQDDDPILEEYFAVIDRAMEENSNFIYEFGPCVRKMTIDFFVRKLQARMMEGLVEKLSSM